jgi:hypothetical protein
VPSTCAFTSTRRAPGKSIRSAASRPEEEGLLGGGVVVAMLGAPGWHQLLSGGAGLRKTLPWATDAFAVLSAYFEAARKYFTPPKQPVRKHATRKNKKGQIAAKKNAQGVASDDGDDDEEEDEEDDVDEAALASGVVYRCLMPCVYFAAAHALDSMLAGLLSSLALLRGFQAREHLDTLRAHAKVVSKAAATAAAASGSGFSSSPAAAASAFTAKTLAARAKRLEAEAEVAEKRWLGVGGGAGGMPLVGLERGYWSVPGSVAVAEVALTKNVSRMSNKHHRQRDWGKGHGRVLGRCGLV